MEFRRVLFRSHPGGRDVQPLRAPGARAHRRDGHLRVRISQHRRASFPQMTFDQGSSATEAISQINVTPLVDVMLVLLIIFMVTAPILQQGVSVDLPKVAARSEEHTSELQSRGHLVCRLLLEKKK